MNFIINKLKPYFVTDLGFKQRVSRLENDLVVKFELAKIHKSQKVNQLEEQLAFERRRINRLEDDYAKFGSFIAELVRLSRTQTKEVDNRDRIETLTRRFFSHNEKLTEIQRQG